MLNVHSLNCHRILFPVHLCFGNRQVKRKMVTSLRFFVLFITFVPSYPASLKSRLDFLEMQVSREAFKTRSDIIELRELISIINATGPVSEKIDNSDIGSKLNFLDEKLDHYIQDQHEKTVALSKAITEEKMMTRKMLKIIRDLADSNTESVLEIEETVKQNEIERENFRKDWKLFEDGIKEELDKIDNNTKVLQEQFKNLDGNVVIQMVKKKSRCPENWLLHGDICYLYQNNEKLSWYGARIRCDDFGGKLAEPDTENKLSYLLATADRNNVWIGATNYMNEGNWVWASSQKSVGSSKKWPPGYKSKRNQNCMKMRLSAVYGDYCLSDNNYICEISATQ